MTQDERRIIVGQLESFNNGETSMSTTRARARLALCALLVVANATRVAYAGTVTTSGDPTIKTTVMPDPTDPGYTDYTWTVNIAGVPGNAIASFHIGAQDVDYKLKPGDISDPGAAWTFTGDITTGDFSWQSGTNVAGGQNNLLTFDLRFPTKLIGPPVAAYNASVDVITGDTGPGSRTDYPVPMQANSTESNSAFVPQMRTCRRILVPGRPGWLPTQAPQRSRRAR
jgi:hypothetical protein